MNEPAADSPEDRPAEKSTPIGWHREREAPIEPVRLARPKTVPISEKQYEQAVRALAAMIDTWWAQRIRGRNDSNDPPT
jgi:hypothetical protein